MLNVLTCDGETRRQALLLQAFLNHSSAIHLYANPGPWNCSVTLADVPDVSGDGYNPVVVSGEWQAPGRIQPGYWVIPGPIVSWPSPAVGTYTAYGATITTGLVLSFLAAFNAPVIRIPGGGTFRLQINLVVASAGLLLVRFYYGHSRTAGVGGSEGVARFIG